MIAANDNGLRFLSVCSGIEAASVAWRSLNWQAVAFSEIEKFPSAVLKHHYPDVPNLGDFTKIDVTTLGRVDIIAGGTPCQAFSVAGLRQSLADARGNLSLEYVRLAHELAAHNGLRNAVWENVVGVLSTKDNAFGCFLAGLVGADSAIEPPARGKWGSSGMVSGPKGRAAWRIQDAQYHGLAQRRRRVLVVADFGNGADPAEVLFERQGVQRHSAPSREAGQSITHPVAPSLVSSGRGIERTGDTRGQDPVVAVFAPEIARCDATREGSSQDYETTTMVAVGVHGDVAHTLKAEGADASEDGTGRGTPIVAQTVALRGREGGATAELGGEVATALRASSGGGDKPHVLAEVRPINTQVGLRHQALGERTGLGIGDDGDPSFTLSKSHSHAVQVSSAVRRLTPKECERLQGFPDDYTAIPWRSKPADQCPDGPRYKALGNSWAVPKFAWLGRRIAALMPANQNDVAHKEAA
ncbi:DNA cytosine methyltransferase [Rhizobium leucaenae]|uniref:DNA cytosine methyltransferase n=1 Tax=Rhizobium leucaenae TaxID=29450 RepID=UPI0007EE5BBC|nr:DNA cytosine methyltransferase [Rhizobium leucaenae]